MPRALRRRLKASANLCLDGMDFLLGRRKELVPPRYLNFAGDGGFEKTGDEFLGYFVKFGQLRPEHRVLEIGSGIGRMARPLTKYLVGGSYEGVDIVPQGVDWCRLHYKGYPNFHFQLADVRNSEYNETAHLRPTEYRFPFNDNDFNFVYLTSVFTHMLTNDVKHYLREISRVLRPGGKCFITYFILNEQSRRLISDGQSSLDFRFALDGCWTTDDAVPEDATAYDESDLRRIYTESSLVLESVNYGAWSGRAEFLSFQDILVARKM
jgi:SAM-dependent methyltransferase